VHSGSNQGIREPTGAALDLAPVRFVKRTVAAAGNHRRAGVIKRRVSKRVRQQQGPILH
jgi:hypothetical protein